MSMKSSLYTAGLVAAAALVNAGAAQAQATGTVNVTATVASALSFTNVQGLSFGTVIPNFAKTVLTTDAAAGQVSFSGAAGAGVGLTVSAPANLTAGTNNLPVSFNLAYSTTSGGAQTTFTSPGSTHLDALGGTLFVYVGGVVTPAAAQAAGAYTGTVTITAAYNGL